MRTRPRVPRFVRSLRLRLALAVVGVLVLVLVVFSALLHAVFAAALVRQFDAELAGDAAAVAGMVEETRAPPWEFEYGGLPEFDRPERPAYFEVWMDDGPVLARSPSLAGRDLPRWGGGDRVRPLALPDGRPGRGIAIRQAPRTEAGPAAAGARGPHLATVVVARGTEEIDATLASVRGWLWGLGVVVLLGASTVAFVAVSLGLRPARALAGEIAGRDLADLGRPLAVVGLPRELEPIALKLDELLARLDESFGRERRFTADVSHELRTPLTALRTTLEVTRTRDRSGTEYRAALDEALVSVQQMQGLVESLLMLSRLDAGQVEVRAQPVALRAFVDDGWRPLRARAEERGLVFSNDVPDALTVITDPEKLRVILANLLANAVDYTAPGGTIRVGAPGDSALFEVTDSGPPIPPDVLPRVFDRFFRADPSRSSGTHAGIGLALVRSLCDVLGLTATVESLADGRVRFRIASGRIAAS